MSQYTSQRKFNKHSGVEINEIWKDVPLWLILKDKGGKNTVYQFVGSNLWV